MASAANTTAAQVESSMSHMNSARTDEVASDVGKNHIANNEETKHHQSTGKRNRGKRKQGKRKDNNTAEGNGSSRSNCESELCLDQEQVSKKLIDKSLGVSESNSHSHVHVDSGHCQSELHRHLNNKGQNHVTEPLKALTHLVEKLGVGEKQDLTGRIPLPVTGEIPAPTDCDVPSAAAACQDGSIDEALAIAKCNSEDEDDADLELPSSLSDFVLGYHEECHYAVTKLPPNDDDIDTIPLDSSDDDCVRLVPYESEVQMPDIIRLITKDLSEPYSIYTYRYFIHNWPNLCYLAMHGTKCVGSIVCKLDVHKKMVRRGYIAMLAVDEDYRKRKLGSSLVKKAIRAMVRGECDEVVLETEITNKPALRLYQNLGFVRDKRLFRYYLNGVDALRLKLWLQ